MEIPLQLQLHLACELALSTGERAMKQKKAEHDVFQNNVLHLNKLMNS